MQRIAKNKKMFAMVRFDMGHVLVGNAPRASEPRRWSGYLDPVPSRLEIQTRTVGRRYATGPAIRVTVATWDVPSVAVQVSRTRSPGEYAVTADRSWAALPTRADPTRVIVSPAVTPARAAG